MLTYYYFHFDPIPFEMVQWKLNNQYDDQTLFNAYVVWCIGFMHNSERFYHHQQIYHYQLLGRRFALQNKLNIKEEFWNSEEENRFRNYLETNKYYEHEDHNIAHKIAVRATLSKYLDHDFDFLYCPPNLRVDITRLWFNNVIDNNPKDQAELTELNYYSEYLKSKHWRQVRALKLLIHRNTCSTPGCPYSLGEAYFGDWSKDLHLHHISYHNKGNERYEDVCLVCHRCHKDIEDAEGEIDIELNFIIRY